MKKLFILVMLIALGATVAVLHDWPRASKVVFCDVGQGDAILIIEGFHQVLIDTGPQGEALLSCINKNLPFWDKKIDRVILTHYDEDHVGGLEELSKVFFIERVYLNSALSNSEPFLSIREVILEEKKEGMRVSRFNYLEKQQWTKKLICQNIYPFYSMTDYDQQHKLTETVLSDSYADIIMEDKNQNASSLVLFCEFNNTLFLFTGDIEEQQELALIRTNLLNPIDVLKIAHHGSKSSTGTFFLQEIRPEHAVISVGKKNTYGHPHKEVLSRLNSQGSQIWRTDHNGEVEVLILKDGFKIKSEKDTFK